MVLQEGEGHTAAGSGDGNGGSCEVAYQIDSEVGGDSDGVGGVEGS